MTWSQKPLPEGVKPVERGNLFNIDSHNGQQLGGMEVKTADWTHVCSARFGEGRPCSFNSKTLWTGDSYRYDIYSKIIIDPDAPHNPPKTSRFRKQYAMRWWNGSGEGWFIDRDDERDGSQSILALIAANPVEERRWDYCHSLYNTATSHARAAKRETTTKYELAFIHGRLKKKRRNKRIYVEIVTPTETGSIIESGGIKAEISGNTAVIDLGG